MYKALFIVNPHSGVDRVKALQTHLQAYLDHKKFDYKIVYTDHAKHGITLAKDGAAQGFGVIVAVGGDGSVNDVINGVHGTDAILGIIPKGSGNGTARSLGIPVNEIKAIQFLNKAAVRRIDLGLAQGHLFASNAGVGFDTVVTESFNKGHHRGLWAYLWVIVKTIWRYQVREWTVEVGGKILQEKSFILSAANASQLGYNFRLAPKARMNDGLFDLVSIRKFPKLVAAAIALRAFSGTILRSRFVHVEQARKIVIRHPNLAWMQIDGEAVPCQSPLIIEMLPDALNVLA